MLKQADNNDPWQYATHDGTERLQFEQTARMSLSERLQALDGMIALARQLQKGGLAGYEDPSSYGTRK